MKLRMTPHSLLLVLLFTVLTGGCKKDKIVVNDTQEFIERPKPAVDYVFPFSPFSLTLRSNGTADVLPGGDIVYGGTYKIKGDKIKVKTEQNEGDYTFRIISKTEIEELEFGKTLILKE